MKESTCPLDYPPDLRQRAEVIALDHFPKLKSMSSEEIYELVLELRIDRAERDLQIKALRDTCETQAHQFEEARGLLESSPDVIARFDRDLNIRYANPAFKRITGITEEQAIGHSLTEMEFQYVNVHIWESCIRDVFKTGQETVIEFDYTGTEGKRNYHARAIPERYEQEQLQSVLVIAHDVTDMVQTREILRQSEERFRTVSELITDYAYSFCVEPSSRLDVEWVYGAFEQITGLTPEDANVQNDWTRIIHPDDQGIAQHRIDELLSGNEVKSRLRIVAKDGTIHWMQDNALPVKDDQGRVVRVIGATAEITDLKLAEEKLQISHDELEEMVRERTAQLEKEIDERKQTQEALQDTYAELQVQSEELRVSNDELNAVNQALGESTGRLNAFFDQVPVGLNLLDDQFRYQKVNELAARYMGLPIDEIIGKTVEGIAPKIAPEVEKMIGKVLETGEPVRDVEICGQYPGYEGDTTWWLVNYFPINISGGKREVGIVTVDITMRKRAEKALRESEERLRLITENSPDVIFFQDRNLRYSWVANPNASTAGERVIGKTDAEIPSIADAERIMEIKRKVLETGEPVLIEFPIIVNGDENWFEDAYAPRRDEHGNIIGLFGYARNITERKFSEKMANLLAEHLQRKTAQLEAANKELESFSYSISHDLRAPLRTLDGFSTALLEDYAGNLDAEGQNYLNRIRAAAQRMAQLIDDLLQLSRTTRAEIHYTTVNLSAQAESVLEELRFAEPERHVEAVIRKGIITEGDETLLRQVLQNLLGNAWKFTSHREDARIEFGEKREDNRRIFFVRDNGAGFDMQYAENLFVPFRRLHTEKDFPGTGIGLSIVKRIIERHGGNIWAESEPGKGTTFYFTLGE